MIPAVTPVIVTRGDVDLKPILEVFGPLAGAVVWDNSKAPIDLAPFGAFAAAAVVRTPLIYFQDDDVIVRHWRQLVSLWTPGRIVCNMAPDFQKAYANKRDKLIGHGGVFETSLVRPTFERYFQHFPGGDGILMREANRIFTGLNWPMLHVEYVGHDSLPYASSPGRLWKQPDHGLFHAAALARIEHILGKEGRL